MVALLGSPLAFPLPAASAAVAQSVTLAKPDPKPPGSSKPTKVQCAAEAVDFDYDYEHDQASDYFGRINLVTIWVIRGPGGDLIDCAQVAFSFDGSAYTAPINLSGTNAGPDGVLGTQDDYKTATLTLVGTDTLLTLSTTNARITPF